MTKRGGRLRNAAHFCFVFVKTVSSFYVVTTYGVFVSKASRKAAPGRGPNGTLLAWPPAPHGSSYAPLLPTRRPAGSCVQVEGPSMWPTFAGRGDVVVAEALTHRLGELKPGAKDEGRLRGRAQGHDPTPATALATSWLLLTWAGRARRRLSHAPAQRVGGGQGRGGARR